MAGEILFQETQTFSQAWTRYLIFFPTVLIFGVFGHGLHQQLVLGEPFGEYPMSDSGLIVLSSFMVLLGITLPLIMFRSKLTVQIDSSALALQYEPFVRRTFPIDEIVSLEACGYQPIREFGGWGIKYSLLGQGWSYTMFGNQGVRVTLRDGRKYLIGSQHSKEFAAAFERAKQKKR